MMKKIYACLLGEWCCLNDDPECKMSESQLTPYEWYEQNAPVYYPVNKTDSMKDSYYHLPYVLIHYKEKDYRINPTLIQIVTE